ncbi:ABC transporter permease [Pararhodobacter oceanensis]|uniref:ABC transporter permease n=1 Tax=Pararhodobacter oceanensis TaxID=2172121 RepID=A0A2T8HRJ2_9RHOB|nr:ABC transporter permease [Pararhodobacter oceanensis]PVH28035.1 ABC transporter permease [Pararhodobacter oceanensis]
MSAVLNMILQRVFLGLLTLLVVSALVFVSVEFLPGDVAEQILGQSATPETLAALREQLGLNTPPVQRYLAWLGGILQGDFGRSVINQREITAILADRLGNTLFLAAMATLIAVPLAVGLGILAALKRNTWIDRWINIGTLTAISFPEFFVAYGLIYVFSAKLGWLPSISVVGSDTALSDRLVLTLLPALTLTLIVTAHMMRMTRASLINLLALPYVEMARLKGAAQRRVVVVHALPNAVAPIVNVIALNIAYMIAGVVIVEVVFVYPGLGQLLVDSVSKRDVTVVQAACLIFASAFILFNLVADVISILSNPRLLHRSTK